MGVWKRMKTVPFMVELAEKDQDERLAEKLSTQREADGISRQRGGGVQRRDPQRP
jgi:putative DNA primase/helicase